MQTGAATLENSVEFPQKVKIGIPYNPAVALVGIYPRDVGVLMHRGTCTPMFLAAVSTITNYGKSLNVLQLMNKEIVVYMHNGILHGNEKE